MELTLTRTRQHKRYTQGTLSIEGEPFCNTLEPTWRDIGPGRPGRKVAGRTAIPEGRYPLVVCPSPRFDGRWLPLLLHVPLFEGVHIHEGNSVDDTQGCILVGTASEGKPGQLIDSRLWLHRLLHRLGQRPLGEGMWITVGTHGKNS